MRKSLSLGLLLPKTKYSFKIKKTADEADTPAQRPE
jgi:hypothetical protein